MRKKATIIQINNLRRHNEKISNALHRAFQRVLRRGQYILGPEVKHFELEFSKLCGTKYCVGVGSGTDALELALRACGVKAKDKVVTTANAGGYSTAAILSIGAQPIYVDVDPETMTMNPKDLARALKTRKNVQAVIITHLYGRMADMPKLLEVVQKKGIYVIEDCAQAHGARLRKKPAGSWGDLGCFSFYPTKNLGALGDGGAVVCNDNKLDRKIRALRQYGWKKKYVSSIRGGRNSRLDELQASILRSKLPYLDLWNRRRRYIAQYYSKNLRHPNLTVPSHFGSDYVAHLYVVRVRNQHRNILKSRLLQRGIGVDIHYPVPDYRQQGIGTRGYLEKNLPVTERCVKEVLTLPCFPEMTKKEVRYVVSAVNESLED